MHIGVDATCWGLPRGFGRHARCLLGALVELPQSHSYSFFTDDPQFQAQLPDRVQVVQVAAPTRTIDAAASGSRRSLSSMARLSWALSSSQLDLVFFPTAYSYVPVLSRARKVVMIHDVTSEIFPRLTFGSWRDRLLWGLKLWLARRQADLLLTVSDHSQEGLAKRFNMAPSEIPVIGEAADPIFRPLESPRVPSALQAKGLDPERPFLVYVGGFAPLKNVSGLLEAFAQLVSQYPELDLILVGEDQDETFFSEVEQLRLKIKEHSLDNRVHFTGFIPDEELVPLLNLATALVLPSFNEGFGLPALEAAACGCPVIVTKASPIPALLGGGALTVDPHSQVSIQGALERVVGDPVLGEEMSQHGLQAASRLSWQAGAQTLLDCFCSLDHDPK